MAGEQHPKKIKLTSETDNIFDSFHRKNLESLKLACEIVVNKQSGYAFRIAKIKACDAQAPKCFSSATCYYTETGDDQGFTLTSIFINGIEMLEAYVKSPLDVPDRKGARLALQKLLRFLSDKGATEKAICQEDATETEWTARVAQHLLSKLAVGPSYMLDNTCKWKCKFMKCTCGCGENLSGQYGDTSFGVPSYWHGRVDILMDVAVTTLPTLPVEESDPPCTENSSSIEMTSDRIAECKEQIRAEAIVFSFLQKKNHPDLDNFLIPTVAMSKTQVAICLYDCQNDILLETARLDLFMDGGKKLKIATVITLWLVLNYKYCCSGIPEEISGPSFKAGFFKQVGSLLEKYNDDVHAPCHYQTDNGWFSLGDIKDLRMKIN